MVDMDVTWTKNSTQCRRALTSLFAFVRRLGDMLAVRRKVANSLCQPTMSREDNSGFYSFDRLRKNTTSFFSRCHEQALNYSIVNLKIEPFELDL